MLIWWYKDDVFDIKNIISLFDDGIQEDLVDGDNRDLERVY